MKNKAKYVIINIMQKSYVVTVRLIMLKEAKYDNETVYVWKIHTQGS